MDFYDQPTAEEVVRLAEAILGLALILFGSLARGDYHQRSDSDFCVVLTESPPSPLRGTIEWSPAIPRVWCSQWSMAWINPGPAVIPGWSGSVEVPEFSAVMRAVVRRLRILSQVHGAGEWPQAEFGPLLDLAETVRLEHHETFWSGYARRSQRGGRYEVEGFVGQAWYAGSDLRPLLPALWLGQWLHTGKGYVIGNGRYSIKLAGHNRP